MFVLGFVLGTLLAPVVALMTPYLMARGFAREVTRERAG